MATDRTDQVPALKEVTRSEGDTHKNKTTHRHISLQKMFAAVKARVQEGNRRDAYFRQAKGCLKQ